VRRAPFLGTARGQVGLGIVAGVVLLTMVGPLLSPHAPAALVGSPGSPPSSEFPLGTDYVGRDVLSRVLWGGRSVLWLSVVATTAGFLLGTVTGLVAGYSRSLVDPVLMRLVDVILAFPPLLFFLIVATSIGSGALLIALGVAIVQAPGVARIVYSATRETSVRGYVEAAVVRGEGTVAILRREILPNILGPVIANFGLSLSYSVLLIAGINFLGLGLQPPAANWGLMIAENRPILSLNVWATVVPGALLVALTIGVNLVGDAIAHTLGRTRTGRAEASVLMDPGAAR
jgi:peptide/nickel transport system permease protein